VFARCLEPVTGRVIRASLFSVREKEDLIVFSLKALAMATAVSAGVVFAMPMASQAMPQSAPVKVDTAKSGIVDVRHRSSKKWARYCRRNWDDPQCHHRKRHAKFYRYRYYDDRYYEPYYGYGYYRPYRPGIGLHFNID
jgi:hypothetical protein